MNRILLVDGNANDRSWVKERLEAAGNEIVCASDATAAIDQLDQLRFDMLLTEWMLRDMSGLQLSHYVRRLRAALEPHACEGLLQTVRGFGYRFG